MPNGAVVLPGLDRDLDEASWRAIGAGGDDDGAAHGHPQAVLHRLLAAIGVDRAEVTPLGELSRRAVARGRFLSQALRPAATTEQWASAGERDRELWAAALDGLAVVEADDEREEALVASLVIREALERTDATAALITPDRGLAERVGAELRRWDIDVDDSAGTPLTRTLPGRLALLAAEAAAADGAPRALLALLAHPLVTLGLPRATSSVPRRRWRSACCAGRRHPQALPGSRRSCAAAAWRPARVMRRVHGAVSPMGIGMARRTSCDVWSASSLRSRRGAGGACDLAELALLHRQALIALAQPAAGEPERLFAGEAGEALDVVFDDLAMYDGGAIEGRLDDYPAFFARLAGEYRVRPRRPRHRRVKIWGLLEARLLDADTVVVGGLDEGVWPPVAKTDAFLNRPMRDAVGLPSAERRIGQTAHDFVAAIGARNAVITRAAKREGAPTVPSRFLQRMRAVAGGEIVGQGDRCRRALSRPCGHARSARGHAAAAAPGAAAAKRTSFRAPSASPRSRPWCAIPTRSLPSTSSSSMPSTRSAVLPGAADRGTIVHEVLGRFAAAHPSALPDDPLPVLVALGEEAFAALAAYRTSAAQWWPRFRRLAEAFARWERARRPDIAAVHAEVSGAMPLAVGDGEAFTLRARADRIERQHDGGFAILDFKTGTPPTAKTVFAGFSPQLTLEAAILKHGGFRDLPPASRCPTLQYLHATGGATPLNPCPIEPPPGDARTVAAVVEEHRSKLEKLMRRYLAGEAGFMARPFAQFARRFNEYDHLARTKEWALADEALPGETP